MKQSTMIYVAGAAVAGLALYALWTAMQAAGRRPEMYYGPNGAPVDLQQVFAYAAP